MIIVETPSIGAALVLLQFASTHGVTVSPLKVTDDLQPNLCELPNDCAKGLHLLDATWEFDI